MNRITTAPRALQRTLLAAVFACLLLAVPGLGQEARHPFGGTVLDLTAEVDALRTGETVAVREAAAARLLATLYRDRYLADAGPRLDLERWLKGVARGEPFDAARFRAEAARAAEASTVRSADVGTAEVLQKLLTIELALSAPAGARATGAGRPVDADAVGGNETARVLGSRDTRVMPMSRIPGAHVLRLNDAMELAGSGPRDALALDLYGRFLAPAGGRGASGEGDLRAGLAHREVGRAVLGPEVRHPLGATTSDVLKGVGPTPWAAGSNRFNNKATGTFPLPEAVRDWDATMELRRAGVAVYEPVAIVAMPFAEWSESEGWRPVTVYVRRARENLRVSDLDHLSQERKRVLLENLRGKIEAELRSAGRTEAVSDLDVIRHFVERAGRTAGLFQGGVGEGRYFFHGMLHDQNVSLMGEIVDVGNSEGFVRSREEMRRNWSESNYSWWPDQLRDYRGMKGDVETVLFDRMARRVNAGFAPVTGGGLPEAELRELFARAYREGRRGGSAADPRLLLTTARATAAARPGERAGDPVEARLERYRRPDGTLDWKRMTRDRALTEAGGMAHFALALFLKEVAVVAATGDRARIEEFFDGLMTTDFYKHYGLFVAGARVSEVAYVRYLERFVRPSFVNGLLKTNLVLATGIALPMIVEGNFDGRTFALSVTSLGLSTAAVRAGVAGIRWVSSLEAAQRTGILARFRGAGRLARLGGWFYTAAELAVILYVADEVQTRATEYLDLEAARDRLADAGLALMKAVREAPRGAAGTAAVEAAADAYHEAWIEYRNFLYEPLHRDEALFAGRLERLAREAKKKADEREAALTRIRNYPALRANIERRHGSVEAYAAGLVRDDEAGLEEDANEALASYTRSRDGHLREVYEGHRRGERLLEDLDALDWLLAGGEAGAAGDPYGSRRDVLATWGRSRARDGLRDALEDASRNRLEAYDDEAEVLGALAASLRRVGRSDHAAALEGRLTVVRRLQDADRALASGDGVVDTRAPAATRGVTGALDGVGR